MKPFRLLVTAFLCSMACACSWNLKRSVSHPALPLASNISTEAGTNIQQKGDVSVPAHVETQKQEIKFTIPKGSELTWDSLRKEFRLSIVSDSPALATNLSEKSTGSTSFSPPTPLTVAQAEAFPLYVKWSIVLILLGGILLYAQHYTAGGVLLAGGFFLPVVGHAALNFRMPAPIAYGGAFLALAGGLVLGWFLLKRRYPAILGQVTSQVHSIVSDTKSQAEKLTEEVKTELKKV